MRAPCVARGTACRCGWGISCGGTPTPSSLWFSCQSSVSFPWLYWHCPSLVRSLLPLPWCECLLFRRCVFPWSFCDRSSDVSVLLPLVSSSRLPAGGQHFGNNNNNNNNNRIQRCNSNFFFTISILNAPRTVSNMYHSSGPGPVVCKSRATHRAHITCNSTCYVPRGTKGQLRAIKFDRVEIAFIWASFYWLNH